MKKTILLLIFVSFCINSFAQQACPLTNQALTYWYYRDRLKYFIVPGEKQGESEVMVHRNDFDEPDKDPRPPNQSRMDLGSYGQEQLFFGQYVGMLATEWALLNKNQQYDDAHKTLAKLNNALNQFDNYMDENSYWGDENQLANSNEQ